MIFHFITTDEYKKLTNPDNVKRDMPRNFEDICHASLYSSPDKPIYGFYDHLDMAFDVLDNPKLTHLVAIDDNRVTLTPDYLNNTPVFTIDHYTLMDVFFIWKGTRKHALERVYENRIFPYKSASEDENQRRFRSQGDGLERLPAPSELTYPEFGTKILHDKTSDRYVAIDFDNADRRFVIVADALGHGFKSHESCQKFITKSHDKYIEKERTSDRRKGYYDLDTAYEQASYCGFGDYADYC